MIKTIKAPHILLPKQDVDWSKYAVVACDQYTSNVEYWDTLREEVGDNLSTLNMIYPEAYLDRTDNDLFINRINKNIKQYLKNKDLEDVGKCFVLVERITSYGVKRLLRTWFLAGKGQSSHQSRTRGRLRREIPRQRA